MNKLIIPNGGMPLFGDDFNFLDDAQRDALKGVLYELALPYDGNLILGGCELTTSGPTTTISAGYVLIDWEVCYFPGTSFSSVLDPTGSFSLDTSWDSDGLKTFANGASLNTYQIRRAVFNQGAISGGFNEIPGIQSVSSSLYERLKILISSSQSIIVFNGWLKEVANQPTLHKHFRHVTLNGGFQVGDIDSLTFTKIAQLPINYRPATRFKSIVAAVGVGVYGSMMLEFFTNGEVYAIATDGNTYDLISVSVTFLTAT